jgi:1-acyl-sn-glycerol-3-phosphate acyltransferase
VDQPKTSRGRILHWLDAGTPRWGEHTEDFDATYVRKLAARMRWAFGAGGPYQVDVSGWENLPSGPVLVVSNHSGGSTLIDAAGFLYGWHRHFAFERPLHVLAHDFLFSQSVTGPMLAKVGALRASHRYARQVLTDAGRDLMVMPGGDQETWRPYRDRYRVEFHGHRGYARLALSTGVPIIPVAGAGAHDTLLVLTQGRKLARRLRLHELLRIDIFPIHLSLPWGLGIGPLPHIPFPARLSYRIGEPILPPRRYAPGKRPSRTEVSEHDAVVRHRLQQLLDRLALERGDKPPQPHE